MTTSNEVDQTQVAPEDEFAAAFAEFTEPGGGTPAVKAEEDDAVQAQTQVDNGDDAAPAEDTSESEAAPVESEGEGEAAPTGESAFAEELAKLREEISKSAEPAPAAPAAESQVPANEVPDFIKLNAEDKKFLDEYEKDWPDISKAEAIKRRQEIYGAVQFVLQQVSGIIQPVVERYKETEYSAHEGAIRAAHDDYDTVRDDVIKWATSQTGVRGKLFSEVVEQGTAEEIAELVSMWKEVHGKTKPQVSSGAGSPSAPAEPPAKAKQAAQKLSVVSSKRTQVPTATDPNDFDSAWAEATGRS